MGTPTGKENLDRTSMVSTKHKISGVKFGLVMKRVAQDESPTFPFNQIVPTQSLLYRNFRWIVAKYVQFPDVCLKSNFVQRRASHNLPCPPGIFVSQKKEKTIRGNTTLSLILTANAEWNHERQVSWQRRYRFLNFGNAIFRRVTRKG